MISDSGGRRADPARARDLAFWRGAPRREAQVLLGATVLVVNVITYALVFARTDPSRRSSGRPAAQRGSMPRAPVLCSGRKSVAPDDCVTSGIEILRCSAAQGQRHKACRGFPAQAQGGFSLSDIAQVEEGSRASETMRQVTDREARPH
jgi:hypothetical protein